MNTAGTTSLTSEAPMKPTTGPACDDVATRPSVLPPQPFFSILFASAHDTAEEKTATQPTFFGDLNLDQIVQAITANWQPYNLTPFFHVPLHNLDAVAYRQEVMRDLENDELMVVTKTFSEQMHEMRLWLPAKVDHEYRYQKERWFLNAAKAYCRAIQGLTRDMARLDLASRGMVTLRLFLDDYVASDSFQTLVTDISSLTADLASIRYELLLNGGSVTVRLGHDETDYSLEVEQIFEKFRREPAKDYQLTSSEQGGMDHIREKIVKRVALLYPDAFASLERFSAQHATYLNETIARFDREVQFYVAYLTHIQPLRTAGLCFCYPRLSDTHKQISSSNSFDLALADKLVPQKKPVVTNDFHLQGPERLLVVSGPNQGGKTTFARTFGQLHYLAALGCPVPGTAADLFLFDQLFTHFERQENMKNLHGKLQDDLIRIHDILGRATPNSVVIMNEIFSSTTLKDAVYLGREVMARLSELDLPGVCVTFLDELASFNEKAVSMVSMIDPQNPAVRTYKLQRRPVDGLAYALAIAQKHHVTEDWLRKRITS